jgi:hypothetical protein
MSSRPQCHPDPEHREGEGSAVHPKPRRRRILSVTFSQTPATSTTTSSDPQLEQSPLAKTNVILTATSSRPQCHPDPEHREGEGSAVHLKPRRRRILSVTFSQTPATSTTRSSRPPLEKSPLAKNKCHPDHNVILRRSRRICSLPKAAPKAHPFSHLQPKYPPPQQPRHPDHNVIPTTMSS